jgi:heterodisulfide reductase subunit A
VIHVGAIIITTGYDIFDATLAGEYGYGRMRNVMHSLEFERILNAAGPSQGEVLRPSDGKIPKKIAWLQCVGSRSEKLGHTYCSAVCCEYAIKQLILAKEHYPETQTAIFFNDMRAYGKGFEDFYNRAKEMDGVRFIRRGISTIKESRKNNNLIVTYISDDHDVREEEFDLIVLSVGLTPSKDNESIAQMMGLPLNPHGFLDTDVLSPNTTIRPGIFTSATSTSPMDVPDSIVSSTGAVSLSSQLLSHQRGTLVQPRQFPEERLVEEEELKIGIFVCHCGANIGRVVDVSSVVRYASTLENVVYSEENLFSCSSDSGRHISEIIQEKGLNRVVVAACTPRTHESIFQDTLREAGINRYLFVMANIREHCSWVHSREKEKATLKAKDIVRMAIARARHLSPLEEFEIPVNKEGLVLGGGLAGMTAALGLVKQGLTVYLVERETELGGNLKNIHYTLEGLDVQPFLKKLIEEVESQKNITLFKGYELKSFSGSMGNFKSTLEKICRRSEGDSQSSDQVELEHGITIVATGGEEFKPTEYHYGESVNIITQQELENMLISNAVSKNWRQIAMIQCVGARDEERLYCGRICCGEAIKNALKLKELNENTEIFIFYRDIRTYGYREDYYAQARQKGIFFIRYEPDRKPIISINGASLSLSYYDTILDMEGEIGPDLVVLSTPVVSKENKALSHLLKVPVTGDGFFMEAHMKLRPIDSTSEGIFLCGLAHYPKYIPETISQSNGAAARAATILTSDKIISSGAICEVNKRACIGCGLCQQVCLYGAIDLQDISGGPRVAHVISNLCKGCGHCNSMCPTGAISLKHFTNSQILSQIAAAFRS